MGREWNQKRIKDQYYQKAKKENYRSRASYKLLQLNRKFKVIRPGNIVVDLGAAPGGWSQIALKTVGKDGLVIGVDLKLIKPFSVENFTGIKGDYTKKDVLEEIVTTLETRHRKADVIISDAAPQLSGIKDVDQLRSLELAEGVLTVADLTLKKDGNLIMKLFQGEGFPEFLKNVEKKFRTVKTTKPPSSRKKSVEMYLVAKGAKGYENTL